MIVSEKHGISRFLFNRYFYLQKWGLKKDGSKNGLVKGVEKGLFKKQCTCITGDQNAGLIKTAKYRAFP